MCCCPWFSWRYIYPSQLPYFAIIDGRCFREPFNNFLFCEYAKSSIPATHKLIVPVSPNEARMEGTICLYRSLVTSSSTHLFCSLNPVLAMRFAISLRRSADQDSWREGNSTNPSSVKFAGPLPGTEVSAIGENIEMDPIDIKPPNDQVRAREP